MRVDVRAPYAWPAAPSPRVFRVPKQGGTTDESLREQVTSGTGVSERGRSEEVHMTYERRSSHLCHTHSHSSRLSQTSVTHCGL